MKVNSWDVRAVDVSERFADGTASEQELTAAASETTSDWTAAFACRDAADPDGGVEAASNAAGNTAHELADLVTEYKFGDRCHPLFEAALFEQTAVQANLLRCIVGNPFRPITFNPSWRTTTVTAIAEGVYADRGFGRLPVLADALEDAGCDAADLLAHLRSPGPHARGCWPVDLILGKS